MMSSVIGIDLSSFAVDLVKLSEDDNTAIWFRVDLTGDTAFQRLRTLRAAMPPPTWFQDVFIAGIEQPFGRGQGRTQAVLQRVYGAVVACLPAELEIWQVHSTEWKKALGLGGNASKEECAVAVNGLRLGQQTDYIASTAGLFAITCARCLEPYAAGHICGNTWPQDALDAYAIAYAVREANAKAVDAA